MVAVIMNVKIPMTAPVLNCSLSMVNLYNHVTSKSVPPAVYEPWAGKPPVNKKIVLNELILPMNEEMRYGVVTKTTYGRVILKNILVLLAPSTLAASYKSEGIFIKIPLVMSMV